MLALFLFFACGEEKTLGCDGDVLQECSADGTCETVQDCAAEDMICHEMGEESHCMAEGDMGEEDMSEEDMSEEDMGEE